MRMFRGKFMVQRTVMLAGFSASLLLGLFAAQRIVVSPILAACICIGVLPFVFRRYFVGFLSVCLIGILIGLLRGGGVYIRLQEYNPLFGESHNIIGRVADDPGYDESRGEVAFTVTSVKIDGNSLIGKVEIKVRGTSAVHRGDVIHASGKLRSVKGTTRQAVLRADTVKIVQKDNSRLEAFRRAFFRSVNHLLTEPYASLGLGYLVGLRADIPKQLDEQLSIVGLTHIVAVSGYNLTILVQVVRRLFKNRSAYQSVVFSGLLITFFVLIAGGSAPITRAAVVSGLSLWAWYYGRTVKAGLLLLLSGALTAVVNPLYVWGDPGWYLSFLAFAGVLIVAPMVSARIFEEKQPGIILQTLIETCGAQLVTIPYTLYLFGGVSVIAPLANVLVLPFIPYIMTLVFLVGVLGMVVMPGALLLALLPNSLLALQVWIIERLSFVPGAHMTIELTFVGMVFCFLALGLFCVLLRFSLTRRFGSRIYESHLLQ